jgi:hypothetical protein
MKYRVVRAVSALFLVVLATESVALAGVSVQRLNSTFVEVSPSEAAALHLDQPNFKARPTTDARIISPSPSSPASTMSFDVGTVVIGVVLLNVLVNIGKSVWDLIEAGRPKLNLEMNVASAVPQGIRGWEDLDSWHDPVSKLYKTQLYTANKRSLGDIYYRLVYTYGGRYKGVGNFLTNVTILPAQLQVPYRKNFYAQTKVTELVNHGSNSNPVAGMTMLLTWGLDSLMSKTMQSVTLHVRGDGGVVVLPNQNDQPEEIKAGVQVTHPKREGFRFPTIPVSAPTSSPLEDAAD